MAFSTSLFLAVAIALTLNLPCKANINTTSGIEDQDQVACFINAQGRGAGVPLDSCPENYEQNGALCYPNCNAGYTGNGPVCWQECPSGFTDKGLICESFYGKGCCCTVFGCCGCAAGYNDLGCICSQSFTKSSYGRGAGVPMICAPGQEENGALCYPLCPDGYKGVGPVCWQVAGTSGKFPVKCNDVIYGQDQGTCNRINGLIGGAAGPLVVCVGLMFVLPAYAKILCGPSLGTAIALLEQIVSMTNAVKC